MRKIVFIIYFLVYSNGVIAQNPIDRYLKLAAENNPGLKAKFNDYLSAMENIPRATSLPDPQVTFGLFIVPVETRLGSQQASLAVNQSFPWFGTLSTQGNVAAEHAEAELDLFEDAKFQLYKEVSIQFNELYYLNKSMSLTEENLELLTSFKELARVNFESGKTGLVNVLRVEMEEKELTSNLEFLKDSHKAELVEFEKLLNFQLADSIVFPDQLEMIPLTVEKQTLLDSIILENHKLRSLDHRLAASEHQTRVAKLSGKPSFVLGASYFNIGERTDIEVANNGRDAFLLPQLGMKLPIFQKKYKAMEKQAIIEKENIQYQIQDETNSLASQLENHIKDYLDAKRRLALYENLIHLTERSVSLLQTGFATGETDFEEVLRMQRKLLTYQLLLEKARVDNNNAIYNINYITGK